MNSGWIGVAALAAAGGAARAQFPMNPRFFGVGDLPGGAFASQALGVAYPFPAVVAVGDSQGADGWRAFRWSPTPSGMVDLGTLAGSDQFSAALGVDARGDTIVGSSGFAPSAFEATAFRWTAAGGMQTLGPLAGGGTPALAHAASMSDVVIVGQAAASPGGPRAFRWTAAGGAVGLGTLPGGGADNSAALGVSPNGNVVVGYAPRASFAIEAFRWTAGTGMQGLGHLNTAGFQDSRARAVSANGDTVVGDSTSPDGPQEAFRWTVTGGMTGLGDLPGGGFRSAALATTRAGTTVVGWSETGSGNRAFIWTPSAGMRDLKTVLEGAGFDVTGWTLVRATAISGGGRAIAGVGINPAGHTEGWVADFGCYVDCNGDGMLSVADLGCFQTKFVEGSPYADCTGEGVLTVADFGCYRSVFVEQRCDHP